MICELVPVHTIFSACKHFKLLTWQKMQLRLPTQQLTDGQVLLFDQWILSFLFPKSVLKFCCYGIWNQVKRTNSGWLSDNIFTLQQWCSTTFPQAKEQLEHLYKEVNVISHFLHVFFIPSKLTLPMFLALMVWWTEDTAYKMYSYQISCAKYGGK